MTYRASHRSRRAPARTDDVVVRRTEVREEGFRPEHTTFTTMEGDSLETMSMTESLTGRVNGVLGVLLLALEGLLTLRFVLVAFGANPASGFVDFVLDVSWPFVRPFDGAFADRTWDEGIIEVSTLLAMGVWLLGFALLALILAAILPNVTATEHRVRRSHVSDM